LDLLLLKLLFL
ncbi:hypothetical protein AVEN_211052-1, partial [Araneus ventricosus]